MKIKWVEDNVGRTKKYRNKKGSSIPALSMITVII
jgi:hypothetical protein